MEAPEEVWKDIDGWEGLYRISNMGRVYSAYSNTSRGYKLNAGPGRILRPGRSKHGYLRVNLQRAGSEKKTVLVHRLVAEHFIENPEWLPEVNHKDSNRCNNVANNLEWAATADNMKHAKLKGSFLAKNNSRRSKKLTPEIITLIKQLGHSGGHPTAIADLVGCSRSNVTQILSGKIWK